MKKKRVYIEEKLQLKKDRLDLYLKREAEMLSGGAMSYGIGSRNLTRYQIDLGNIRKAITELEDEIAALEEQLDGNGARGAVAVVIRDF